MNAKGLAEEWDRIVLATRNNGKMREFRALLAETGWEILGLDDVGILAGVEETGRSFAENARQKAVGYSLLTGLPVLADDSGLEVFALGGKPGLYSSRYAGEGASDADRIAKLLNELSGAGEDRSARFFCALALARDGAIFVEAEGECRGLITGEARGTNGFGYDPVFLFPELGRTYAELLESEKNRLSHRARAVQALLARLARGPQ